MNKIQNSSLEKYANSNQQVSSLFLLELLEKENFILEQELSKNTSHPISIFTTINQNQEEEDSLEIQKDEDIETSLNVPLPYPYETNEYQSTIEQKSSLRENVHFQNVLIRNNQKSHQKQCVSLEKEKSEQQDNYKTQIQNIKLRQTNNELELRIQGQLQSIKELEKQNKSKDQIIKQLEGKQKKKKQCDCAKYKEVMFEMKKLQEEFGLKVRGILEKNEEELRTQRSLVQMYKQQLEGKQQEISKLFEEQQRKQIIENQVLALISQIQKL